MYVFSKITMFKTPQKDKLKQIIIQILITVSLIIIIIIIIIITS